MFIESLRATLGCSAVIGRKQCGELCALSRWGCNGETGTLGVFSRNALEDGHQMEAFSIVGTTPDKIGLPSTPKRRDEVCSSSNIMCARPDIAVTATLLRTLQLQLDCFPIALLNRHISEAIAAPIAHQSTCRPVICRLDRSPKEILWSRLQSVRYLNVSRGEKHVMMDAVGEIT